MWVTSRLHAGGNPVCRLTNEPPHYSSGPQLASCQWMPNPGPLALGGINDEGHRIRSEFFPKESHFSFTFVVTGIEPDTTISGMGLACLFGKSILINGPLIHWD